MRSYVQHAGGSILLPREVADHGTANWPKCAECMRNVDAYGIDNQTDKALEVWARCDGQREGGARVHAPRRAGFTIDTSRRRFTENTLTDVLRRLTLRPGGTGHWVLEAVHPDVVRPA